LKHFIGEENTILLQKLFHPEKQNLFSSRIASHRVRVPWHRFALTEHIARPIAS
jgi:hypothetical protein